MKCPHCEKDIPDSEVSKHLASKGGSKSRRTITIEQQAKMQQARRGNETVTVKILSDYLGVSRNIIMGCIRRNELISEKIKGRYIIRIKDVAEWYSRLHTPFNKRESLFDIVKVIRELAEIKKGQSNGQA